MFNRLNIAVIATVLGMTACTQTSVKNPSADAVYINGAIYSMQSSIPWTEGFAIKDGKFIAVGDEQDIKTYISDDTKVVDLKGQFVMPGIQDTHMHTAYAAWFGINLNMDPDLSWPALTKAIKDYAAANPNNFWIFGGNLPWYTDIVGEFDDVPAHKSTLDNIIADRPLALYDIGMHALLANSLALELAGITAATPDPVGGTIERDENGEPTGVLRELAGNLISEVMDPPEQVKYNAQLLKSMEKLQQLGVTSITEVWSDGPAMRGLMALEESGQLTMRVTAAIGHPIDFATEKVKEEVTAMIEGIDRYQGDRLQTRYVKFVLDGSAGGQSLVMNDPYEGTDFRGHYRNPREQVIEEVTRLHGKGIGSVIHAVGDGAIRTALDAVENAIAVHGDNGVRHSIAHTVFVNPADMDRFAKLGVNAEFSPYFWWPSEGLEVIRDDIGERTEWGFPVKEVLERGNHVSAGSDWPVVYDPNPFPAIEALVTREVPGSAGSGEKAYGAQYAISLEQALNIFTLGGAYVNYAEEVTGSIEVGKLADFIVLDRNLFEVPIREIHQTQVLKTVINGDVVFAAKGEDK